MAIDRTQQIGPLAGTPRPAGQAPVRSTGGPSFQDALQGANSGLQFSSHAAKRIDRRDLNLDQGKLDRLNSAVSKAAQKGARNSVVMLDDLAVVVDVRDRKVVTAINAEAGKERVFTNIDSVVIA
jgi:flagellar operon protein